MNPAMTDRATAKLAVLLFTDVVGSTEFKSRLGTTAYARLLGRHNALFEHAAASCPGAEILKHTGDGYFAAFPTPADAVRCALLFQRAMRVEPWQPAPLTSRVGIHVGEVAVMDMAGKSDVVGLAADLASRVTNLAAGGQILMTRFAFDEARRTVPEHPVDSGETPPPLRWVAHGPYLLKGADDPLDVFEVGADEADS